MTDIIAKAYRGTKENPLPIGRVGENQSRRVIFDLTDLRQIYGAGTWKIVAKRPLDTYPYMVGEFSEEDNAAVWVITDTDVGIEGLGLVELRYYPTNTSDDTEAVIYKTQTWVTYIENSLRSGDSASSPYADILDAIAKQADRTEAAAGEAQSILNDVKNVTVELTKSAYNALSTAKKNDGTIYLVTDEDESAASYANISTGSKNLSLLVNAVTHVGIVILNGTISSSGAGWTTIGSVPNAYKPKAEIYFTGAYGTTGDNVFPWCIRTTGVVQAYLKNSGSITPYGSGSYAF